MSSGELRRTFESRYLTGTFQLLNSWTPSLSYFFFDTVQRFNISAYKIDKVCNAFVKCLELKVKFWTFYTFWLFDLNLVVLVYRSKMTKSKHLWPDCINTQQPSGFVSGRVWKHWQIKPLWKGSSQSSFKLNISVFQTFYSLANYVWALNVTTTVLLQSQDYMRTKITSLYIHLSNLVLFIQHINSDLEALYTGTQ